MELPLGTTVMALMAIGARVSGLMIFAPFIGGVSIPMRMKAVLAVVLTAVLYPAFAPYAGQVSVAQWPLLLTSEMLVGIAIGITTNLVFDAANMAGQVVSVQMGYSLVNILDPQTQVDTNVMSVFVQTFAMLIFLTLDVHHWILRAIAHSFQYLPPGSGTPNAAFTMQALHVAGSVFGVGVQIAAPVLTASIIADFLLGLLGKASPQMPLIFLGPAIKGLFGLLLLSATMHYWPDMFARLYSDSLGALERVLHLAR